MTVSTSAPANAPAGIRTRLYDHTALDVVIDRMAREATCLLGGGGPVAVVGVLRRGAPLADRLVERMVQGYGLAPPLRIDLAVRRYADDLTLLYPDTQLTEDARHADLQLGGCALLVVDDVLYQGHSIQRVVDYLAHKRPAAIRVAVLADRCVATLPVHADVVGLRLEVAPDHIVECHVPPYEADFGIHLLQPQPPP
jgi:pyrimidine operon attenuation protein / uracil phosphoribosyltransferase